MLFYLFYVHFIYSDSVSTFETFAGVQMITLMLSTGRGSELLYEAGGKTERGI